MSTTNPLPDARAEVIAGLRDEFARLAGFDSWDAMAAYQDGENIPAQRAIDLWTRLTADGAREAGPVALCGTVGCNTTAAYHFCEQHFEEFIEPEPPASLAADGGLDAPIVLTGEIWELAEEFHHARGCHADGKDELIELAAALRRSDAGTETAK